MQAKPRRKRQRKPQSGYDQALKDLLLAAHDAFLALIAPGMTWRAKLSEELPGGMRRADLVWEVETSSGERAILHIELQLKIETWEELRARKRGKEQRDIRERMIEYALRLYMRDHLPVYSVVIFLKPGNTPEPYFGWSVEGRQRLRFDFDVIRLWEQSPEVVLQTEEYHLWPLAGLMGEVTADTIFAVAEKIIQAPVPRQEKSRLTGLLGLLAGMRLPKADLMSALERDHMIEEIWEESSFAEAVTEILGKKTARRMARVGLEKRFGPLSDDVLAAIQSADEATLEEVVGSQTLEEARKHLGLS